MDPDQKTTYLSRGKCECGNDRPLRQQGCDNCRELNRRFEGPNSTGYIPYEPRWVEGAPKYLHLAEINWRIGHFFLEHWHSGHSPHSKESNDLMEVWDDYQDQTTD